MRIEQTVPNVHWCRPKAGRIKLNMDGSCRLQDHHIRGGGVIRNEDDLWLSGFNCHFGSGSFIQAELLVIEHGLELTWKLGH
ncbi:hypothetical protein Lal_00043291 [Lupinus albus]|nr:hypothetical protein Lal_00043291 [Lupinus albus]